MVDLVAPRRAASIGALGALLVTLGIAPHANAVTATTYYACVKKRGGAIRLVARTTKCRRNERKISFNGQGVPGRNGLNGKNGTNGKNATDGKNGTNGVPGPQGPAAPGAANFSANVESGSAVTLAALSNGLTVTAACSPSKVSVSIATSGLPKLQISGTAVSEDELASEDKLVPVDVNNTTSTVSASGKENADFDVVARDSTAPKFARIDVHGSRGTSSCTFWGMVIPAS
jgi:hypothetical protein